MSDFLKTLNSIINISISITDETVIKVWLAPKPSPETIDKNKYIPGNVAANMKNNYRGSMPITPRKFIERYGKAKGLDSIK